MKPLRRITPHKRFVPYCTHPNPPAANFFYVKPLDGILLGREEERKEVDDRLKEILYDLGFGL